MKSPDDFIIKQVTRCDDRKPQTVNRGIGRWISFSCTFCSLPSSLFFLSYGIPMGIFRLFVFFTFLSNYCFPESSSLGICLLAWHLSSLVKTSLTFILRLFWLYFFCFFVPDSSFILHH